MKVHSNDFKEEIKQLGKQQEVLIEFGDTTLTSEYINSANPSYEGSLLKSVMKQLELDCNIEIPVGTEINFKYGLLIDGDYEYIDYGKYIVKEVERQEDTRSFLITCYDKILYSMKDYESFNTEYPITIREYITKLCNKLGLTFANANQSFVNYNKEIPVELYLDNNGNDIGFTFRDVLDELAQVTASTICINANDQLEIRYITDTNDTINEQYLKDINVNFGKKYGKINSIVLSRAGESDNIYLSDEDSVEENGLCELKIVENQIMNFNNRKEFLPEILNKLNGTEYYLNDFTSTGIMYYDLCDRYNVQIGDNIYSCVMLNDDCNITQGLEEIIYTEEPETSETDYTKADKTDRKINQTYIIVDKQNQQIEAVISQTTEQNEKINRVTQTVDELNSKISDIADITTSKESNEGFVEFEKVNESEPIRIVVRPIAENISYLYPRENLFPSDTLFPKSRTIRFENITNETYIDYELPTDLLYYDNQNYDEFILDYDAQTCLVNKKVGYNADGTTYVLETPLTLEYNYPQILLEDGDYKISVLGYSPAYIFARVMAQNIYTTQFATKAEVSSSINQTAQNINLEVSKKVGNNEIISKINQTAEAVTIDASKININGTVSANGNFKVDTNGNMECNNATVNGGLIRLKGTENNVNFIVEDNVSDWGKFRTGISAGNYTISRINANGFANSFLRAGVQGTQIQNGDYPNTDYDLSGHIQVSSDTLGSNADLNAGELHFSGGTDGKFAHYGVSSCELLTGSQSSSERTRITATYILSPSISQTSTEESKKNFEKLENALDIVKKTDIYKYNFKSEENEVKKHIGFVIGDNYKYAEEITSKNNDGADIYGLASVCLQAIKEQQEQIELLQKEINKLKGEK